jgi:hypoxanthine phosphoribosyltransferase
VDDVSVSGKTLEKAREVFDQSTVITMVMKGKADICAFPNISQCVYWPWKV